MTSQKRQIKRLRKVLDILREIHNEHWSEHIDTARTILRRDLAERLYPINKEEEE